MPHPRLRYAESWIKRALSHSPVVGIMGQRQVGKTTLAEKLSSEYVTFDRALQLQQASDRPMVFLENRRIPFAIDEAQLCPPLFPAVKEWVRLHPKKGQVILTGSVRFTSRGLIRESLTGRIVNVEILPMTVSEMNNQPLPQTLQRLIKISGRSQFEMFAQNFDPKKNLIFDQYLKTGGLPGVCFFRDDLVRHDRFEAHLDTVLNRDIQQIVKTTLSPLQIRKLATYLAENQGVPIQLKAAASACQSSTATVKKILYAFEAIFLIRPILNEGTVSKIGYYFEDQGLATYLAAGRTQRTTDLLRGLYSNLRQELHYRPHPSNRIFSYLTHDGTTVPLILQFEKGIVAIIPTDEQSPTLKCLASARSFLAKYPSAKVIIACNTTNPETRDFKILVMPYSLLL